MAKSLGTSTLVLLGVLAIVPARAHAQGTARPFGVGATVGDPAGLTAKVWLSSRDALQVSLGWHTAIYGPRYYYAYYYDQPNSVPYLSVDWVRELRRIQSHAHPVYLSFHVGVGGGVGWVQAATTYYDAWGNHYTVNSDSSALSVRAPLGINLGFSHVGLECFAEAVPTLLLAPTLRPDLLVDFGARYYF